MRMVLDTGVLIADAIPDGEVAVPAIALAELEFGVAKAARSGDAELVLSNMRRLTSIRAAFGDGLPVTGGVAAAYGRITDALLAAGRSPRPRVMDLLIAATALHHDAAVATTNGEDFAGLERLLEIVVVPAG